MSRYPEVKWAERLDKLYITVQLPCARNIKVNLEPDGLFTFSATGQDDNLYELKMNLHDKVNVEESKINTGMRNIFCVVHKAEKAWWKKLLLGDGKKPHYVKVDWDKWVDADDDDGAGDLDLGGMDFSNFDNMGGMGGEGMGDDFDDSDDEENEMTEAKDEKANESGETENAIKSSNADDIPGEASSDVKMEAAPSS